MKRATIHQEKADITGRRIGKIPLSDQVTFTAYGLKNLVEIGFLARIDLEYILAARTLKWLQNSALLLLVDKGADFFDAFRDERRRTNGLRKALKIKLVLSASQTIRIIHRQHTPLRRKTAENNAGLRRPRPLVSIKGWIVAQEENIDIFDRDRLYLGLLMLQGRNERISLFRFSALGNGRTHHKAVVRPQHEIARRQITDVVAVRYCSQCKRRGRVKFRLVRDRVHKKSNPHSRLLPLNHF